MALLGTSTSLRSVTGCLVAGYGAHPIPQRIKFIRAVAGGTASAGPRPPQVARKR
ncbi:MAG: hypothetical protein WCJ93_04270 [Methanomicrobiales archaeon]